MPKIVVKILKNGSLQVETIGMRGDECKPYIQKMCDALQAIPLILPDNPQPFFHQGEQQGAEAKEAVECGREDTAEEEKAAPNRLYQFQ